MTSEHIKELWWVTHDKDGATCRDREDAISWVESLKRDHGYSNIRIWRRISDENGTRVEEWKEPEPRYVLVWDDGVNYSASDPEPSVSWIGLSKNQRVFEYLAGQDMRLLSDAEVAELRAAQR